MITTIRFPKDTVNKLADANNDFILKGAFKKTLKIYFKSDI